MIPGKAHTILLCTWSWPLVARFSCFLWARLIINGPFICWRKTGNMRTSTGLWIYRYLIWAAFSDWLCNISISNMITRFYVVSYITIFYSSGRDPSWWFTQRWVFILIKWLERTWPWDRPYQQTDNSLPVTIMAVTVKKRSICLFGWLYNLLEWRCTNVCA